MWHRQLLRCLRDNVHSADQNRTASGRLAALNQYGYGDNPAWITAVGGAVICRSQSSSSFGTLPPLSAIFRKTVRCSHMFISAEPC